jgi:RTX calcium-binding nonapeptide repeat (4 copies)
MPERTAPADPAEPAPASSFFSTSRGIRPFLGRAIPLLAPTLRPMQSRPRSLHYSLRVLAATAGVSAALIVPAVASADPSPNPPAGLTHSHGVTKCFGMVPTIVVTHADRVTRGTDGNDVIVGTDGRDVIVGGRGDDRICAGGGADKVIGGAGNDMLDGGPGDDLVAGWSGNDTILGGGGDDILHGNEGDDVVYGGYGPDVDINLGPGSDWAFGGNGNDFISGYGDGPAQVDHCFGGLGWDHARNCDAPVDPLTGLFDPWSGNQIEKVTPSSPH